MFVFVPCWSQKPDFPNEKGRQVVIPGGLCMEYWWSWGDLNPRPQAIFEQIYMFSGLI